MADWSSYASGHAMIPPPFKLYFHRIENSPAALFQFAAQVLGLEGGLVLGANGIGGSLQLPSGQPLLWNGDTGISRGSAGRIYVGNGTNGDRTGAVEGTNFQVQNGGGYFLKDASNGTPNLICQADNNIVFYSTNAVGASRAIWSVSAESSSAPFIVSVPLSMAASAPVQWNSDTGFSRDSAGVIDVGNGTQGDTSGNLQLNKITKYAGVATVANGVPALVAKYDATAQAANITSTLLYAVPASAGGFYRVSFYEVVTQAATSSSALPGFFVSATDNDTNVAYSSTVIGSSTNGSGNTVGVTNSFTSGSGINNAVLNLKGGTNLNFLTSNYASTGATPMQYAIHVKVEYLG